MLVIRFSCEFDRAGRLVIHRNDKVFGRDRLAVHRRLRRRGKHRCDRIGDDEFGIIGLLSELDRDRIFARHAYVVSGGSVLESRGLLISLKTYEIGSTDRCTRFHGAFFIYAFFFVNVDV